MRFDQSPSVDDYQEGLAGIQRQQRRKDVLKKIILGLLFLVILMGLINLADSKAISQLRGTGTVTGRVVRENQSPLRARLFVLGTEQKVQTGPEGEFTIENVPAGRSALVIGYRGAGIEIPLSVSPGETTDLGTITFISTLTPSSE
jgi:hypothetical protein